MVKEELPKMSFQKKKVVHQPIKTIRVNGKTIIAIYKGNLSDFDILIKYRQKLDNGGWSRIRTPKHVHWTVDILMKMQTNTLLSQEFIDFFIQLWRNTTPLRSEADRLAIDLESLLNLSQKEIDKYEELSKHGEYSVRFLILLAKLLMLQEKTNRKDAYMFGNVLTKLKTNKDLFGILSTASLGRR